MERDSAVRWSALRLLLAIVVSGAQLRPPKLENPEGFAAMLAAGHDADSICAAFGLTVDELVAVLVRLAR